MTVPGVLVLFVLGLAIFSFPNATPARAQNIIFRSRAAIPTAGFLPPPRVLRQEIRLANEAIAAGRMSEGVVKLGDLLRQLGSSKEQRADLDDELRQDYFIDPIAEDPADWFGDAIADQEEADTQLPSSTTKLVRQLIGRLPAAGRELYELRYGPLAERMLQQAAANRDWDAVGQVRCEFFHTKAGYRASILLARRQWLLGHALAASLLLDEIVQLPPAIDELGDGVILLHADACQRAGREVPKPIRWPAAFTQDSLAGLPADSTSGSSSASSSTDDSKQGDSQQRFEKWRNWIAARQGDANLLTAADATDYRMLGGDPSRNDFDGGQLPLSQPRWMLETTASPRQERIVEQKVSELGGGVPLPPPSWMPLRVGDQLLMRTTGRLLGVDYQTGKRVWQYPWFTTREPARPTNEIDDVDEEERVDPEQLVTQRVWNDVPFGQLSSDRQRVYMIDDLGPIEVDRFGPFGMRGMTSKGASSNTLVALDLATEGKLLWQLGASETIPSPLSEAFFLGPPLPINGKLYVMAELAGEIVLVCLRPEDGTELWRQVLVSVEAGSITADPIRRVAGAMPTHHQGMLICPTGAGATVAIDLADRTLRWGVRHPRNEQFVQNVFRPNRDESANHLLQRWNQSLAVASDLNVILTPVESDRLIVADVVTGQLRFEPEQRIHELYVAGIRDDRYLVISTNRVSAHSIRDGSTVWATSTDTFKSGQQVCGRGVFGGDSYFVPTTSDELIELSLEDGSVVERRQVRFPLGNLVAIDGELISQSPTTLSVAFGQRSLRPRVDARLEENPDDVMAVVHKAQLLLEEDRRGEALRMLRRARQLDPDNDDALLLSVTAMLETLRENPTSDQVDLEAMQRLIDRPVQLAELLVLRISGMLPQAAGDEKASGDKKGDGQVKEDTAAASSRQQLGKAFRLLTDLSRLAIRHPHLSQQQALIFPDSDHQFTLDSWIAAWAKTLLEAAPDSLADEMKQQIQSVVDEVRDGEVASMARTIHHFTVSPLVDPLREQLAARQIQLRDSLAGERILLGPELTTDRTGKDFSDQRLAALAEYYSLHQWREDQRRLEAILAQRQTEQETGQPNQMSTEAAKRLQAIEAQLATLREWQLPSEWPETVSANWRDVPGRRGRGITINRRYEAITRWMGSRLEGHQLLLDYGNPFSLLNPYGIPRPLSVNDSAGRDRSTRQAYVSGGLMVIMTTSEVIGVDLFQTQGQFAARWRYALGAEGESVAKRTSSTSPFGDQLVRHWMNSATADSRGAELRMGPIWGDRMFLMKGTELVCLDTLTGTPLWQTDQFSPGGVVLAADGKVAVVSDRHNRVTIFDAMDGRVLETRFRNTDHIMLGAGRHVLAVKRLSDPPVFDEVRPQDDASLADVLDDAGDIYDPHLLELYDPFEDQRVLTRIASPVNRTDQDRQASYGHIVDGRYYALLDNEGQATIWDVLSGESIADVTVPVEPNLTGLSAFRLWNRTILLPRARSDRQMEDHTTLIVSGGAEVSSLTGIHAISNLDGRVQWSRQFESPWSCTLHQPAVTPLLTLVRGRSTYRTAAARRRELDVLTLDVATGETVHQELGKITSSRNNNIETHVKLLPHRDEIRVEMQGETLLFSFADDSRVGAGDEGLPDQAPAVPPGFD